MIRKVKSVDAKQGVELNRVRWVLAISTTLAVIAIAVVATKVV